MKIELKGCDNPMPHIKIDGKTKVSLYLYGGKKPLMFINKDGKNPFGNVYLVENGIVRNFPHTVLEEREVGTYEIKDDTYFFDLDINKIQ